MKAMAVMTKSAVEQVPPGKGSDATRLEQPKVKRTSTSTDHRDDHSVAMRVPRSRNGSRRTCAATTQRAPQSSMRASTRSAKLGPPAKSGRPRFLDRSVTAEGNEDKPLSKDGHKRGGQGDATEKMLQLWMLLGALEKRAPKKPRRLGVAPNMLVWLALHLGPQSAASAEETFDATMLL